MRLLQQLFKVCALGNDGIIIELGMTAIIVRFDVLHIDRFRHTRQLVNFATIIENGRRVGNETRIGFEINRVDFVKAYQSDKQADIGFGKAIAGNVPLLLQNGIHLVKGVRQFGNGLVVGTLLDVLLS